MKDLYETKLKISNLKKENLLDLKDNGEIDFHQTVLNIGYHYWQNCSKNLDYAHMISYMEENYGELFSGLILAGKLNQQVCNGGFIQYYNNGYADGIGNCNGDRDVNHPLHMVLINFIKEILKVENFFNEEEIKILEEYKTLLIKFIKIPIDLDETTLEREWIEDEEKYYEEEVENYDYGTMDYVMANKLDQEYYNINQKVMDILEKISKEVFIIDIETPFDKSLEVSSEEKEDEKY